MKKLVCFLLFTVVFLQIRSQDIQEIQLKHWSSRLGLASDAITSFAQDYKGFLWIGTNKGLNRFDGQSFLTIPVKKDGLDINIKELFSYKKSIYVFTNKGDFFQIDSDDFSQSQVSIDNLEDDELKNILLEFQESKLEIYNGDRFKLTNEGELFVNGSKIIGVYNGLYKDSRNRLWIVSIEKGIGYWDSFDERINFILPWAELASLNINLLPPLLSPKVIMTEGANERIWIYQSGGSIGFWDYDLNKMFTINNIRTHPYLKEAYKLFSVLIDVRIKSLFLDKVGNLWIGTSSNGMFRARFKQQPFQYYEFDYSSKIGLANEDISCPTPLNNGNVWIGTWGGGINTLKKEDLKLPSPEFEVILPQNGVKGSLQDGQVFPIFEDSKENIWVGSVNEGLHFLSKEFRSKRKPFFVNYNKENGEIISDSIMNLYEDRKGVIWISMDGGLSRYLPNKKIFESEFSELEKPNIFKGLHIYAVFEDSKNNLWISSKDRGLFRWDRNNNEIDHIENFENFSTSYILNIVETPKNTLWFSGMHGLFKYNLSVNNFDSKIDTKKLSTNYIESMIVGPDGLLWLGTNIGMFAYNPIKNTAAKISLLTGLNVNSFTRGVSKDNDGYLYFGTRNGFYRFHPNKLLVKKTPPPTFTDLKIDGISYRNRKKYESIDYDILVKSKINLSYEESTFSIHYNNLNYYVEDQVFYETSMNLKGEKENWTTTYDTSKFWTNLNEGNYIFKIRNNNNSITSQLNIKIASPWWRTNVAFVGYFIFVLLGSYFLVQVISKRAIIKDKKLQDDKFNKLRFKFFLNIAHEIRTPLTLIKGGLELLNNENKNTVSNQYTKELDRVTKNTDRLARLVNEVLDLKKIERTEIELKLKTVNLKWFLENVIDVFNFRENEISLTFNAPKDPIWMASDKQILESIVYNLISNAIKYSKANAKIEVSLFKPNDNEISIQVKDNGFGIKKEEQQLIFERLYQSDEHLKTGTGIGLAIVKQYVDILKGSIDLKSDLNIGSTFTVTFPHETADFELKTTAENDPIIIPKKKFGSTLLIVDDQKELRTFIKEIFEDEHNIIEASNGEEGLKLAKQQQPSLIISDVMMPVMDGIELCRRIRNDITVSHIPIIFLTAKTSEESEVEGISSGADGYVNKPFSQKILKSRVNVLIENRKKLIKKYGVSIDENIEVLASNDLDRAFLERFEKILSEQYSHSDLSVEELASEMAVSVSGFYTKIKSITGLSPVEFVRTYRLKRAAQLLKSTNISVTEVSEISGFGTQKYFSNIFKKHFGITPLAYRKE